jgi:carbamoyl-phosphate synthase large subunit
MSAVKTLNIALTGLNNIDSPGPGIPVARALRSGGLDPLRIIGLAYDNLEPGLYMHELINRSYQIPYPSAGSEALFNRLKAIHEIESIDVVIPNFDAELHNFMRISDRLRTELGIRSFLPDHHSFEMRQKSALADWGEKLGIKVPATRTAFSWSEARQIASEWGYPLMVKGKYYDAYMAYDADQAAAYFYKLSAKWGLPVLLQQIVKGSEVNVTALGDGSGACIGAVPMRKMFITDKGKAWAGITLHDDRLIEIARTAVAGSCWRGGCELEFIKTPDDHYYLIEMNPRFPAWVYLAVGSGQNHPEALVRLALGEAVEPMTHYEIGKMFIRYSYDQIVDLKEYEHINTHGWL